KVENDGPKAPNPRRVAAGKRNRAKRQGLTPQGRTKLRQSALAARPWQNATGPRTPEGKARAAQNGKVRQTAEVSTRAIARELAEVNRLMRDMAATRRLLRERRGGSA